MNNAPLQTRGGVTAAETFRLRFAGPDESAGYPVCPRGTGARSIACGRAILPAGGHGDAFPNALATGTVYGDP